MDMTQGFKFSHFVIICQFGEFASLVNFPVWLIFGIAFKQYYLHEQGEFSCGPQNTSAVCYF